MAESQPVVSHWRAVHSFSVVALIAFFVWMAAWRPAGLFVSWVAASTALALFTLIVGKRITGVWKGTFVDDRLRMSHSRLQMVAWTILVTAAFGTIAIGRTQVDPVPVPNARTMEAQIVASRNSNVYHIDPGCRDAQAIKPGNRVTGGEARQGRTLHVGCPR